MDAILLAGGVPAPDAPLYPYTLGKPKANLEIAGQPMIQRVLDALNKSSSISRIVVVGCEGHQDIIQSEKIAAFVPATDDILLNFQRGADAILEINPDADSVAVVSSDLPFLTVESVDWVINTASESDHELYYCVIDQKVMEKRYPESNRSYVRLKDINVCGGDINVVKLSLYTSKNEFWRKLFETRKNYLRQASLIGIDLLLLLLLRRLSLEEVVHRVSQRLEIKGRGLLCPFPEIGMDIDKPHQLELARRELS